MADFPVLQAAPGADAMATRSVARPKILDQDELDALSREASGGCNRNVNESVLDVAVTLSMEVGRTRIPIRDLLQLEQGAVVELERDAVEALDVFVNGAWIARGEIAVVNGKLAIRLAEVISPAERIRKIKL